MYRKKKRVRDTERQGDKETEIEFVTARAHGRGLEIGRKKLLRKRKY